MSHMPPMREKILRATANLMAEGGAAAVSTRDVCKRCEITAPTLYYYFKSKKKLLEDTTRWASEQHSKSEKIFQQSAVHKESFKIFWDQYVHFAQNEPALCWVWIWSQIQKGPTNLITLHTQVLFEKFEVAASKGLLRYSSEASSQVYIAGLRGAVLRSLSSRQQELPQEQHLLRDLLLEALFK